MAPELPSDPPSHPPISGSYRGRRTGAAGPAQRLDLRIDVDERVAGRKVLHRVSGDLFRLDSLPGQGGPAQEIEVYLESWVVDAPEVRSSEDETTITGAVRYWEGVHPATTLSVRILPGKRAKAEATLESAGAPAATFVCSPAGSCFRSLHLQVDVCRSVAAAPVLPRHRTGSLAERPEGLANRTLTLGRAYREAGLKVVLREEERRVIDDSAEVPWTDAELHNAMERHYAELGGTWPQWEMWGLLAGLYQDDLVGGLMFDYASAEGGAGRSPQRRGFAIFRRHEWFAELAAEAATTAQREASRKFLWAFVHESGHALNLVHSFEKEREAARSWMNYDWRYDSLTGHTPGAYWRDFAFTFDDEELLHLRHGNRASVILGGDPWSSGGHAESAPGRKSEAPSARARATLSGSPPLEILVRAQTYFEFLEPVSVEVRVRNLLPVPVTIGSGLHPELGGVSIYVRRPDGRIVEYAPLSCKLVPDRPILLSPAGAPDGSDRYSRTVFVSYGRDGFYVDEPGQYQVRAVYGGAGPGAGNLLLPSEVVRLRIGHPKNRDEDRKAQDFFSYESGAALYLGGSQSPFLAQGMDTLLTTIEEQGTSLAGAKTAARIARGVGLPFHDLAAGGRKGASAEAVRRQATKGDPELGLKLTALALATFRRHRSPRLSFTLERAARTRADLLLRLGEPDRAHRELAHLARDLGAEGVKASVLEKVELDAARLKPVAAQRKPRPRKG